MYIHVGVMLDHPYTVYIPLVMYIVHMISIHLYTPVCVYTKDIGSKVGAIPTTHSGIQYVVLLHLYIVVSYVYVYIISLYKDTPAQDTLSPVSNVTFVYLTTSELRTPHY